MGPRRDRGFTLIELMVVLVIVAILAAIGYPSYQAQAERARRADGKSALLEGAQAMERCRTQFGVYNVDNCPDFDVDSEEGHYRVTIANVTATGFDLTATAQGVQLGDEDCRTFTLDELGAQGSTNSGGSASTDCW